MDSSKKTAGWQKFTDHVNKDSSSIVAALVRVSSEIIAECDEHTVNGLMTLLDDNINYLFEKIHEDEAVIEGRSNLSLQVDKYGNDQQSLQSAYKIYKSYLIKSLRNATDSGFENIRKCYLAASKEFEEHCVECKKKIQILALDFIKNGITIFVYGYSRLTLHVLQQAAAKGIRFSVITSECRPRYEGYNFFAKLEEEKIPVKMIVDSAIAYALEMSDIVLVGAEAVVENGGIINRIGTYTTALCAKAMKKPFYVMAESFKFSRQFPLSQKDLPEYVICKKPFEVPKNKAEELGEKVMSKLVTLHPLSDYTPPELITLIFTDLGITPNN